MCHARASWRGDSLARVYPVWPVSASRSVLVSMLNVTTVVATALFARLSVHVMTAAVAAVSVAPMVTVSTFPAVPELVTVAAAPPVVAVHVVAASAEKKPEPLGVIFTVPPEATAVVGVKVTTKSPPAAPPVSDVLDALPHPTLAANKQQSEDIDVTRRPV